MTSPESVVIRLRPSRRLTAWLVGLHGSVLLPIWSTGVPTPVALAISAAVLCHGSWAVLRQGLLANDGSILSVAIDGSHRCAITLREGRVLHGSVAATTVVTGRLVILAIRARAWRPLTRVVIPADATDAESFRRMRVLLRWAADREPAGPPPSLA